MGLLSAALSLYARVLATSSPRTGARPHHDAWATLGRLSPHSSNRARTSAGATDGRLSVAQ